MLYLYGIKALISHFFSLSFHWATPTPQLVSPCFIPELFLSSSLFVCFLSALAHCHHHMKLCDRFGVFAAPWGGWINLEVSLSGFRAIFSKKRYEFFSLRFYGLGFFLGILRNTPEFLFLPCFWTAWTGYIHSWGNLEVDIIFLCIISWWVCALRHFFFYDRSLLVFSFSELICNVAILPIFMNIASRFGFFFNQ